MPGTSQVAMKFSGLGAIFASVLPVVLLLMCLVLSGPVAAQNNDTRAMRDALERISQDLADLQRYVYRDGAPAAPSPISSQKVEVGTEERRAADTLVHVTALEGELRGLTGAIEEITHKVDTVGRRLDKLVEDVDFRLAAIERSLSEATAMATQQLADIQPEAGSTATETVAVELGDQVVEPSNAPGVLGTIPVGKVPQAGTTVQTAAVAPEAPKSMLPDGTPKERYDFALRLLREGLLQPQDLARAEQAFEEFLTAHADHNLADNARYWLGESFYVRGDYNQAAAVFVEGYKASPAGTKAPDNLLKLGMSLSRLSRGDEACATFQELNQNFPDMGDGIKARTQKEWQKAGCE